MSGGGAERVVCNLSNYLVSKGEEVTILTMSSGEPAYELDKDVEQVALYDEFDTNNKFIKNIKRFFRIKQFIKNNDNTDIYIVMLPITILLLLHFRRMIKVPIIISERGDPVTRYANSKIHYLLMKYFYPKADNYVFQTKEAKDFYANYINGEGTVIPNAINKEFFHVSNSIHKSKRIIASGRLNKQKNFELLIRSFSNILEIHPEWKLEIIGEGPERKNLEELIQTLNLQNHVFMPGYVEKVIEHLVNSSIFVMPSNYEGMPNALIEAMALGLPSISTDCEIGGPRFLIDDGKNGLLVPVNNQKKMTESINKLVNDPIFAERLGANASLIKEQLAPKIIYSKWHETISETIKEKNI
ncbi:glycosyltransferase family 4 protein [Aerococcus viridans]|uniref:glycosyltransferase family 4 protein n=1 Tax=Aerococcus viridans TaxID=1377 RepID=UPI003AA9873B